MKPEDVALEVLHRIDKYPETWNQDWWYDDGTDDIPPP